MPTFAIADTASTARAPSGAIPVPHTPLLGREHDVDQALDMLRRPYVRMLTLTGAGGVGKTRMAIEVARRLQSEVVDGVCFVPLAAVDEPRLVATTIARALGIAEVGERQALASIAAYLQARELLLVVDGFEHVLDAGPILLSILEACPGISVLVASRAALRLSAEHELGIAPLQVPPMDLGASSADAAATYPAVELFVQRARAVRPDFRLDSDTAVAVAQICARLDGLPLAIELAAARVRVLEPEAMVTHVSHRLQLLTGGARDLPARHRTIRDAIAWSYDLLNPDEQRAFRVVAQFVGGCTLQAAAALLDAVGGDARDVLEMIDSLIDKSMAIRLGGPVPRFGMLETIQEYGAEVIAAEGEEAPLGRAHAAWFLAFAEEAASHYRGPEENAWLDRFAAEKGNFDAALRWYLDDGKPEAALRLGVALAHFWYVHGHLTEGCRWLEEGLKYPGVDEQLRVRALHLAGFLATYGGDYARAEALATEGLERATTASDEAGRAGSLAVLALAARLQGRYDECRALSEQSVSILRRIGDNASLCDVLGRLSAAAFMEGDFEAAEAVGREAYELADSLGDVESVIYALSILACALALGRPADDTASTTEAENLLRRATSAPGSARNRRQAARTTFTLGVVALRKNDFVGARDLLEEASKISDDAADDRMLGAFCLPGLATALSELGRHEDAAFVSGAAEAMRGGVGVPLPPGVGMVTLPAEEATRTALGETRFAAALARGRAASAAEVLATLPEGDNDHHEQPSTLTDLTRREAEILRLVSRGLTDAEVAEELVVSRRTVHAHLRAIYRKIDVKTRSAATRYALEHDLA